MLNPPMDPPGDDKESVSLHCEQTSGKDALFGIHIGWAMKGERRNLPSSVSVTVLVRFLCVPFSGPQGCQLSKENRIHISPSSRSVPLGRQTCRSFIGIYNQRKPFFEPE
jgi:hypothetical protein